jgi:hypothetical protein
MVVVGQSKLVFFGMPQTLLCGSIFWSLDQDLETWVIFFDSFSVVFYSL